MIYKIENGILYLEYGPTHLIVNAFNYYNDNKIYHFIINSLESILADLSIELNCLKNKTLAYNNFNSVIAKKCSKIQKFSYLISLPQWPL